MWNPCGTVCTYDNCDNCDYCRLLKIESEYQTLKVDKAFYIQLLNEYKDMVKRLQKRLDK